MTRNEIISALENATGPDRELDGKVALLVGHTTVSLSKHRYWSFNAFNTRFAAPIFSWPQDPIPEFDPSTGKKIVLTEIPPSGWEYDADVPEYTASIDAAMTLVPKNCFISTPCLWPGKVGEPSGPTHLQIINSEDDLAIGSAKFSDTPALAICIAALKAKGG